MKLDEIMELARKAGFVEYELEDYTQSGYDIRYERFAALAYAAGAAAEREAIADELEHGFMDDEGHHIQYASEIRARGQA